MLGLDYEGLLRKFEQGELEHKIVTSGGLDGGMRILAPYSNRFQPYMIFAQRQQMKSIILYRIIVVMKDTRPLNEATSVVYYMN